MHIRGLKRPFANRTLLELLGTFGKVAEEEFWIDTVKSNCIVKVIRKCNEKLITNHISSMIVKNRRNWHAIDSTMLCGRRPPTVFFAWNIAPRRRSTIGLADCINETLLSFQLNRRRNEKVKDVKLNEERLGLTVTVENKVRRIER